ncbi:hypothetical protein ASPCADRAFT_210742 [Aspergillus carbonarius ITEM 5010]|uniref:Uncharacterized protein n=1 Tax=Aspergillus carbonarius (strain ITEM 5010) TaxID=602072 RepID=A0A1R3RB81_ASPC5|nr:hypothetical protein ASPCADRAFT_210742 [Aspergillus carbonarius ITEM 5010]
MDAQTRFQLVRRCVRARVGKTNVVHHDLTRIFDATKRLDHTALTDSDLETLGLKVSTLDLEGAPPQDHHAFYRPLARLEVRAIDWERVRFSEWTEGYSDEPRRVEYTLQSVSNKLWCSWLEEGKKPSWMQRK